MKPSFQYPFDFVFREELVFETFFGTVDNASLLHFLQTFAQGSQQFCYLWGKPGSGKTHLLQALSHASDEAVYLPLGQLQVYGPACLDGLEHLPFLVLDDLDCVAGNSAWEEALFALFNTVHAAGNKLCMAAGMSPAALPLHLADLKSRLQLSVVYEVIEADEAVKEQILIQRALARGIELKPEVAAYILQRSERDLHTLMAMLDKLDTLSLAEKRRVTIPFVRESYGW